jgi:uvrABC system protein C
MDEVLRRRLTRLVAGAAGDDAGGAEDADAQADPPAAGAEGVAAAEDLADAAGREAAGEPAKARRFAYRPDLILVDGGLAQVNAAQRVVEETGADVRIAGLAKRLEEVWVPGEEFPVILPRTSPALRLLQQLRDESHRFAIAFHRRKRSKAMTRSSLDAVAGLGPAKQKALLAAFGSVAKIKRATVEDLESVRGIGPSLARAIVEHFRSGASDPGARPVA